MEMVSATLKGLKLEVGLVSQLVVRSEKMLVLEMEVGWVSAMEMVSATLKGLELKVGSEPQSVVWLEEGLVVGWGQLKDGALEVAKVEELGVG